MHGSYYVVTQEKLWEVLRVRATADTWDGPAVTYIRGEDLDLSFHLAGFSLRSLEPRGSSLKFHTTIWPMTELIP